MRSISKRLGVQPFSVIAEHYLDMNHLSKEDAERLQSLARHLTHIGNADEVQTDGGESMSQLSPTIRNND